MAATSISIRAEGMDGGGGEGMVSRVFIELGSGLFATSAGFDFWFVSRSGAVSSG